MPDAAYRRNPMRTGRAKFGDVLRTHTADGNDRNRRYSQTLDQVESRSWTADVRSRREDVASYQPVRPVLTDGVEASGDGVDAQPEAEAFRQAARIGDPNRAGTQLDTPDPGRQAHVDSVVDHDPASGVLLGRDQGSRQVVQGGR